MKVLQINVLGSTLSTGRTTRETHNYLTEKGIESYIACPTRSDNADVFAFSSPFEVKLDYKITAITSRDSFHSHIPTIRLLRFIRQKKPDIVHLRVLHGNAVNLKMLLSYLSKKDIATVITVHDLWWITGMCCHYTSYGCDKWKNGCGQCPAMVNDIRQRKIDRTAAQWKIKKQALQAIPRLAVVGVSDWVISEVKQSFLNTAQIVSRVYNWVDNSVFYPREDIQYLRQRYHLQDKYVVLAVSTYWYPNGSKGLNDYLNVAKALPQDTVLILIGQMYYEGEFPQNVICVPKTDNADELACYYSMADVYLNLSKQETFGKVSAEAVSCGTPLIAYDVTANGELVPDGAGIHLKTCEPEEVIDAILAIRQKDKREYIPLCVEFARSRFDKKNNIEQYITIYNDLLKGGD